MISRKLFFVCAAVLIALYFLYAVVIRRPATPMTVSRANELFGGLNAGQQRKEVEDWLASEAIPAGTYFEAYTFNKNCYEFRRRPEGGWNVGRDNKTPPESAGLKNGEVSSTIAVYYPEADRFLLRTTVIVVYLFFDSDERLLRHWVDEFHLTPWGQ